jgi:hypothetical protein
MLIKRTQDKPIYCDMGGNIFAFFLITIIIFFFFFFGFLFIIIIFFYFYVVTAQYQALAYCSSGFET